MVYDDEYLKVLIELSSEKFQAKTWLLKHFELYKTTLNWPDNLPPISRSFLSQNHTMESFNYHYLNTLCQFEYTLNNKTHSLKLGELLGGDSFK
jgi:hypothetical protein